MQIVVVGPAATEPGGTQLQLGLGPASRVIDSKLQSRAEPRLGLVETQGFVDQG